MLEAVPDRVVGGVVQPEVGPHVDDADAALDQGRHLLRGRAVGEGEEDGLDVGGQRAPDGQARADEMGVERLDRLVVALPAHEADDADVRVAAQEPDELRADVAGRPDDGDPDRIGGRVAGGCARVRGRVRTRSTVRLDRRRPERRAHGRAKPLAAAARRGRRRSGGASSRSKDDTADCMNMQRPRYRGPIARTAIPGGTGASATSGVRSTDTWRRMALQAPWCEIRSASRSIPCTESERSDAPGAEPPLNPPI